MLKVAIAMLCVLIVLALLAVPVLDEGLSVDSGPDRQMAPSRIELRGPERVLNLQTAPGGWNQSAA